jgi:uncharacterized protein
MMRTTETRREAIPSNYFAPKSYVKSEASSGLLSTRQGKRLVALPELLLTSIHEILWTEAGEAASMAFYTFGFSWGKSFYERIRKEIELYYEMPIAQMNAPEFFAILQQLWGVHGLGRIIVDFSYAKEGLLLVTIENSGISSGLAIDGGKAESKSFNVEAGFLGGWFSANTQQNLAACATDWDTNHRRTQYLVGAKPQIEKIETDYVSQGISTLGILKRI